MSPNHNSTDSHSPATRETLLHAAAQVFVERGYRAATIRQICDRAGTNIASVNYYFGGKEPLYLEAIRFSHRLSMEKYPASPEDDTLPAEERLRQVIYSLVKSILDQGEASWHSKLLARELKEPSGILKKLFDREFRQRAGLMRGIIRQIVGVDLDEETALYCQFSVISQCVFYHHSASMITETRDGRQIDSSHADQIAAHVTAFSLAALKHYRPKPTRRRGRRP